MRVFLAAFALLALAAIIAFWVWGTEVRRSPADTEAYEPAAPVEAE